MKLTTLTTTAILAGLLLGPVIFPAQAAAEAVLGQSCALTGPTGFLGTEMHRGARAYFEAHGDGISLEVRDDGYEPDRCIANTNTFIREGVTALFGYVGTPTAKVAVPIARERNTIFFGAFTGAGFLSDHRINPHAFSVRASYDAEIEQMVRRLEADLGVKTLALFVQRDAFGLAGVTGAVKAVGAVEGVSIVPPVPEIPEETAPKSEWDRFWRFVPNYPRNTVQVGRSARMISGNRVDAVIMVGAYRPCAAAINLWRQLDFNAVCINISFVGSRALAEALGENTDNVYITQVVPDPWNANIPVVREYQAALGGGDYGFVSLEGYISAKTIHAGLRAAGPTPDFAALKRGIESLSGTDLGGLTLSFGPADHRGLDPVYLTAIEAAPAAGGGYTYKFRYVDRIRRD